MLTPQLPVVGWGMLLSELSASEEILHTSIQSVQRLCKGLNGAKLENGLARFMN